MKQMLLLGATSDIARAIAERFGRADWGLLLAGRDPDRLEREAADLRIRTDTEVNTIEFDALARDRHGRFVDELAPLPDAVVCAFGYLGDTDRAEKSPEEADRILETNFNGAVSVLRPLANRFADRGSGTIIGISSVAGDRGRGSNYYYGSAKAGFTAWLSGLRNRLYDTGVHVITVKPGFVRTRMTEGMPLPGAVTADPAQVAAAVEKAMTKKRDVVYTLWMWRFIMLLIRAVPEPLFKRLKL